MAIARSTSSSLLLPAVSRLVLLFFSILQPVLMTELLQHLQLPMEERDPNIGYGILGAYAITYLGLTVSFYLYFHSTWLIAVDLDWILQQTALPLDYYGKRNPGI